MQCSRTWNFKITTLVQIPHCARTVFSREGRSIGGSKIHTYKYLPIVWLEKIMLMSSDGPDLGPNDWALNVVMEQFLQGPAKWRNSVYVLTEICHQRSKWLGPWFSFHILDKTIGAAILFFGSDCSNYVLEGLLWGILYEVALFKNLSVWLHVDSHSFRYV